MKRPIKEKISLFRVIIRLMPIILESCPKLFILSCIFNILRGISIGVLIWLSQKLFDITELAIKGQADYASVVVMALVLGGVTILSHILNGINNFIVRVIFDIVRGHLTYKIHNKAARIDPIAYEDAELYNDINKAMQGKDDCLGLFFVCITPFTFHLPLYIFMSIYFSSLNSQLVILLVLIFFPVVISYLVKTYFYALLEDESAPLRRELEYYKKSICDRKYFKETRMLGAFSFFYNLYRTFLISFNKKVWKFKCRMLTIDLTAKLVTLAGYCGILYLIFTNTLSGKITVGAFAAVFSGVNMLFNEMKELIYDDIGETVMNLGTVRNLFRFFDISEKIGTVKDIISFQKGNDIVLDSVYFKYPGSMHSVIKDVSFTINHGETFAIVGENGSGKTTLVKLIIGMYKPDAGNIKIGSTDIHEISMSSCFRKISAIFQNYQRYKMTLKDNITISDMKEDKSVILDKLDQVVKKSAINIKNKFPQEYQTMLSCEFGGIDISGGQWQRVAIARGLYREHDLIVLDEPTAAIDPLEETRIYKQFTEIIRGKTAIIVTHRLGTAKIADKIVVMKNGEVIGIGTHDELMTSNIVYSEMYNTQAQWYSVKENI